MVVKNAQHVIQDGERTRYQKVKTNHLVEHPEYSRRSDWVRRMRFAGGFRRWLAGTIIAVEHKGRLIVVDGLKRLRQYRRDGVEEVVVMIITDLSKSEIHELFIAANDVREPVTAFDRFRHNYMAQSPVHLAIVAEANKFGFCVPLTQEGLRAYGLIPDAFSVGGGVSVTVFNQIRAYDVLVNIYEQFGPTCLTAVFEVLQSCFCVNGDLECAARKGDFLLALARLLSVTGDENRLIAAIKKSKADATNIYLEGLRRFGANLVTSVRKINRHNSDYTQQVLSDIWLKRPWRKWLEKTYSVEL